MKLNSSLGKESDRGDRSNKIREVQVLVDVVGDHRILIGSMEIMQSSNR